MKVDCLYWDTVTVACPSDPSKAKRLGQCYVEVRRDGMMWISEKCTGLNHVFGSVELLTMSVVEATFRGKVSSDMGDYQHFCPVEIICTF